MGLAAPESREQSRQHPWLVWELLALLLVSPQGSCKPLKARSSPAHPVCFSPLEDCPACLRGQQHASISCCDPALLARVACLTLVMLNPPEEQIASCRVVLSPKAPQSQGGRTTSSS